MGLISRVSSRTYRKMAVDLLDEKKAAEEAKWRNVNEDEILRGMTEEEIEALNFELMEMDPDNCDLPAGLRQMDQTKRAPTGPLDREGLLKHLIDEANAAEDQDELVPYEAGVKRGKVFKQK